MSAPPGEEWTKTPNGWRCPACGKEFIQRGLSHSCRVIPLEDHFRGRARARELFDAYRSFVERAGGPFRLSIAKTRIGFISAITFAGATIRRDYLRAGFLLLRKIESDRFVRVEHFPPYWVHYLEIRDERDLDDELHDWLREAWLIGSERRFR